MPDPTRDLRTALFPEPTTPTREKVSGKRGKSWWGVRNGDWIPTFGLEKGEGGKNVANPYKRRMWGVLPEKRRADLVHATKLFRRYIYAILFCRRDSRMEAIRSKQASPSP